RVPVQTSALVPRLAVDMAGGHRGKRRGLGQGWGAGVEEASPGGRREPGGAALEGLGGFTWRQVGCAKSCRARPFRNTAKRPVTCIVTTRVPANSGSRRAR